MVDGRVDMGMPHHPPQCIELRSRIREIGAVESPKGVAGRIDLRPVVTVDVVHLQFLAVGNGGGEGYGDLGLTVLEGAS